MDANRTTSGCELKVNRPGSVFLRQIGFPTGNSPGQTRFASAFRLDAERERLATHLKRSVVVAVIAVLGGIDAGRYTNISKCFQSRRTDSIPSQPDCPVLKA